MTPDPPTSPPPDLGPIPEIPPKPHRAALDALRAEVERLRAAASARPVPLPTAEAGGDLADEVRRLAATVEALARSSPPALVPVEEAARALGLSVSTVRRRVKDGAIPSRKLGRALRVDLAGLRPLSREEVVQEARKARAGAKSPVPLVSRRGT